ncbi:recombination regulator RecX [Paraburkholderia acidicola]|uniref:Regulatory protein RecX n=1 Tax=Paraburkholderia acidicola TaxID=1912599 RepID=A0ABV1LKB6_9BURK
MIRKGRPVSDTRRAGGPRDDESRGSSGPAAASDSSADPFESFDDHDRAAGLNSDRNTGRSSGWSRPTRDSRRSGEASASGADASASETVYSRSRRTPGESGSTQNSTDTDPTARSTRPGRSLKGRALGYLSRREYSRAELSRKLMPFADEADPLEALLDELERDGWLSDSRFAESLINRRASRVGASRIVSELKRHAVSQTLIEETGAQLRETEMARAQAVWRKKYGALPTTVAERARQARFLMARGFSQSIIGKILKGIDEEWSGD